MKDWDQERRRRNRSQRYTSPSFHLLRSPQCIRRHADDPILNPQCLPHSQIVNATLFVLPIWIADCRRFHAIFRREPSLPGRAGARTRPGWARPPECPLNPISSASRRPMSRIPRPHGPRSRHACGRDGAHHQREFRNGSPNDGLDAERRKAESPEGELLRNQWEEAACRTEARRRCWQGVSPQGRRSSAAQNSPRNCSLITTIRQLPADPTRIQGCVAYVG